MSLLHKRKINRKMWELNSQVRKMKTNSWGAVTRTTSNKINFHKDPPITEHRCSRWRRRKARASSCHQEGSIRQLLPTKTGWHQRAFCCTQGFSAVHLKNKHFSVWSSRGLKSMGLAVAPSGAAGISCPWVSVQPKDFLIHSYSIHFSDQLAVELENWEDFPPTAHVFLQITTISVHVSWKQGLSSLATSGQKTAKMKCSYPLANHQSRCCRNILHQPEENDEGCTFL